MKVLRPGRDYKLWLPTGRLSFTQIDTYLRCSEKYRRRYVLRKREPTTPALLEGSAMADVLEVSGLAYVKKGSHISPEEAKKRHKRYVDKHLKDVPDKEWGDDLPRDVYERGIRFIEEQWPPNLEPVMVNGSPGVEYEFEIELAGVPVHGFIDIVEEDTVVDAKVAKDSRFFPLKRKYDVVRSIQLGLYAIAVERSNVGFYVFEKGSGQHVWLNGTRDLTATKKWLERVVSRVAHGISNKVFVPCRGDGNALCSDRWCTHWSKCAGMQFAGA